MLKWLNFSILLKLAIPFTLSSLVESSLGFTATAFLAHLGPKSLAAGSLVAWFFALMMVVFWGLFSAVSVAVANRRGAKDDAGIANVLRDGFHVVLLLTLPITLLIWHMAPLLYYLGQKQSLVQLAVPYLHALALGVFPDLLGLLLLQFVVGLGHARTNLIFILSWAILNITANYVFIFGFMQIPALGIAGLGWGAVLSYWVSTLAWLSYMLSRPMYRQYFTGLWRIQAPFFHWPIFRIGLPTGLMWCIEVGFFFVLSLLMGALNVSYLAATQVTMQYVTVFVSILFAISQAITVQVSERLGAKDLASIPQALLAGMVVALSTSILINAFSWWHADWMVKLDFSRSQHIDPIFITHVIIFLHLGLVSLLFESIRISLFGALRGLQETTSTLISSFCSFWVIALPIGSFLVYRTSVGILGYWYGLLCGAAFGILFLYWRYCCAMRRADSFVG